MYEARSMDRPSIEEHLWPLGRARARRPNWRKDWPPSFYGRGNLCRIAGHFINDVGLQPTQVFERDEPAGRNTQVAVCIVTSPYVEIERSLRQRGFLDVLPFYDYAYLWHDRHPLAENGWYADPFDDVEQGRIAEVWHRWEDPISRAHHLQFIAWRRIREEWTFANAPVTNEDRYFIPEVRAALHDHEVFLDGGAYHGDVAAKFVEVAGGDHASVVLVEPDAKNAERAAATPWTVIRCALGSGRYVGYFRDGFGYASRLGDASNGRPCKVETIDGLTIPATFIKLHLEGGELDALRGAIHTLRTHRPVLAVTVYHSADGIWRTPEWLMANLEDYRFLFRNHCWCGAGAVVYAIPNERAK